MKSKSFIERYLYFLLRHRLVVALAIGAGTLVFVWCTLFRLTIFTNFFDLYPPHHPYIEVYTKYRKMFGTSNVLMMVIEVQKDGTRLIHTNYLSWIENIVLDIKTNLILFGG